MKKIINEKTVTDLRAEITKLGYFEKNGQLSSAGVLNDYFVGILSHLINEWKTQNKNLCKLTFTAGNDVSHKKGNSRHPKGEAVDVLLGTECRSNFIQILEKYKSAYFGFAYIDKYTNPSKGETGHFHISYRQGLPEGGKNNKEDGDDEVEVKSPTKSDSSGVSVTTTTTTKKRHDVYGGLLNTLDIKDKSGQSALMNAGKRAWAETGGKIQNALAESTEHNSNNLNEEVRRIKKMMNL